MTRRQFRCSFCGRLGHYWPTCRKKFRTDALAHRVVANIVNDEITDYLIEMFGKRQAGVLRHAGLAVIQSYNRAGARWHLVPQRLLTR